MKVPEDCPLKECVNVPVSCPCYNLQNCDIKLREMEEPETCKTCAKRCNCDEQVKRFMTQQRIDDPCLEKKENVE